MIIKTWYKTPAGRALQSLMTPLMEITLRDELERDLSDFANAVTPQISPRQTAARKIKVPRRDFAVRGQVRRAVGTPFAFAR